MERYLTQTPLVDRAANLWAAHATPEAQRQILRIVRRDHTIPRVAMHAVCIGFVLFTTTKEKTEYLQYAAVELGMQAVADEIAALQLCDRPAR